MRPSGRGNGSCIDLSPVGLLTHGAGSSVIVSDPRSMQLLCVLPMPSSSLASFITVVRRAPPALAGAVAGEGEDDEDDCRPLRLTAGDHHDRIVVWDARVLHWLNLDETRGVALVSIGGVQDLCWIHHASGWLLAAINGPSLLCIWEMSNNPRVLWMFDATPETTAELEAKLDEGRRLTADKFVSTICDRVLHSNCSPSSKSTEQNRPSTSCKGWPSLWMRLRCRLPCARWGRDDEAAGG
jgi:WD repeat-containing protein 11